MSNQYTDLPYPYGAFATFTNTAHPYNGYTPLPASMLTAPPYIVYSPMPASSSTTIPVNTYSTIRDHMIVKLVEGTLIDTSQALAIYETHRKLVESVCEKNSEDAITYMVDRLFWRVHWSQEPFPGERFKMSHADRYAVHVAKNKLAAEMVRAEAEVEERARIDKANDWSKDMDEKIVRLTEKVEMAKLTEKRAE